MTVCVLLRSCNGFSVLKKTKQKQGDLLNYLTAAIEAEGLFRLKKKVQGKA